MATSKTPRLGIMRWTDNADPYPTRAEWDAEQVVLENRVAVWRGQGTLDNRPPAGVPGGFYIVPTSDSITLYYDTGAKWIEGSQVGGVVPSTVAIGGSSAEGSATRAARADHTHAMPLSTPSQHGAMDKADKSKLDASTSSAGNNTLAQRDSSGGSAFTSITLNTAPTATSHATRKDYVDGLVSAVRAVVDAGTASATANTLVKRDGSGNTAINQVTLGGDPSNTSHAARKAYVDAQTALRMPFAIALGTGSIDDVRDPGYYYQSASGPITTANGYPINGAAGALLVYTFGALSGGYRIQEWTQWSGTFTSQRKWLRTTNSATSWTPWRELAGTEVATTADDGLMSKADKSKLDSASSTATANTLVQLDSAGRSRVKDPSNVEDIANKRYTDATASSAATAAVNAIPTATSSADGLFAKADKAKLDNAVSTDTASRLVIRDSSGRARVKDPVAAQDISTKAYTDSTSASAASSAVNAIPLATSSVDGLMRKADKALLDTATQNQVNSALVQRSSLGGIVVSGVQLGDETTKSNYAARKDYVDGLIAQQVSAATSLGTADLNDITVDGNYIQTASAQATAARNYPGNLVAGLLVVSSFSSFVYQEYTQYRQGNASTELRKFRRGKYSNVWSDWYEDTRSVDLATSSVDGLMSKADKALLDGATYNESNNTLVKRAPTGLIDAYKFRGSAQPQYDQDLTRKDYVDNAIANAVPSITTLPAGTDLNTVLTPGTYYLSGNYANKPLGGNMILTVKGPSNYLLVQTLELTGSNSGQSPSGYYSFNRTSYKPALGTAPGWMPWREIARQFDYNDNFQAGRVSISPSAANTPTSVRVNFRTKFPAGSEPIITVTPSTTVPGSTVTGWSVANHSESGFDCYVTRTNTTTTWMFWTAMLGNQ